MNDFVRSIVALVGGFLAFAAAAQHAIVDSRLADSYLFMDHYEIVIDKAPEDVWPHVVDVPSWMGLFHESGPRKEVGEVFRLYENEDFFFETTKLLPDRMLLGVLQPFEIQGEKSLGMGMFVLTDLGGKTLVTTFLGRHFAWLQEGPNPMRRTRESDDYLEIQRTGQNAALRRLKALAESE